jgi:GT2 family glycosyltransferase
MPTDSFELAPRPDLPDDERALQDQTRARYAGEVEGLVVHRLVLAPKVTLVVVSYRAQDYLLECLRHLKGQTVRGEVPYEILLADSGGLEHLRDRYGGTVDVELRLRSGLPLNVARNAAMAWARAPLVAFIDDDGLVSPDWVAEAIAVFEDPTVIVARGRIVPKDHPLFNAFVVHYDRGDTTWEDDSLGTEGNMMVRRAPYLAVGGFPDDAYGGEGVELVYRLKRAFPGARALYAPRLVMRHDYFRSMREFIWKARKYRSTTTGEATRADPEFRAFLAAYMRSPKPKRPRSLAEFAAYKFLRGTKWVVERVGAFDRVKRR